MAHIYNSQLDAFELYHRVYEDQKHTSLSLLSPDGNALPALGHAIAGSIGSAVSNFCTYPLDLIVTRLQIQRQLRTDISEGRDDEYESVQSVAQKIYETEGGFFGFYTGLVQDTGKTIADSFFFFLAYNFLRRRRMIGKSTGGSEAAVVLSVLDELGIGFLAGSFTKLLTAPVSNIVTRKQTSALTSSRPGDLSSIALSESRPKPHTAPSTAQIARDILHEKGILGFWSGYSAALVLTLNPSLTFLLFETFKRILLPRSKQENPPPSATFFMAAISKACASSVTYPFSVAKARAQVSSKSVSPSNASMTSASSDSNGDKGSASSSTSASERAVKTTIFSTILSIVQSDGPKALYSGLFLELVKSFLSHGTTMIVKQYVHRFIIQAYYVLSLMAARLQSKGLRKGAHSESLVDTARDQRFEYYDLARHRAGERYREAKEKADGIRDAMTDLGGQLVGKTNETADLVADYVEDETEELRSLYGQGLAKWFDEK